MKQKQLLSLRAFLCLALTVILGVLCMLPLFEVNVKVSNTTADDIITVLEGKKIQIKLQEDDLSEKELNEKLESYDELINELKRVCYYSSAGDYEAILYKLVVENEENGTPLPYGFKTKEDVEKWNDELSKLLDEEADDENREAFAEKCLEWSLKESMLKTALSEAAKKELETEVLQLEKEINDLAKKIKPSALSRLKEDSLGYDVKLSLFDLITTLASRAVKPILSATDLICRQINGSWNSWAEKNISKSVDYADIEIEHFKKAIAIELLFNVDVFPDEEPFAYMIDGSKKEYLSDVKSLINGKYAPSAERGFSGTYRIVSLVVFIATMAELLVVVIITLIRTIMSLLSIRNPEKFFQQTQKNFTTLSARLVFELFAFSICCGGKLSTFGVLSFVLIILGYAAIGVTARCTVLDKQKALYLDFAQVGGLVGVIGTAIILLSGSRLMSGILSMQTALIKATILFDSMPLFIVTEIVMIMGLLLLYALGPYFMNANLKRLACIPPKKRKIGGINGRLKALIPDEVWLALGVLIFVVFAFLGMDVNALLLAIGSIIVLGVEIALKIINEKMFDDISNDDKDILNALGGRYFDPESSVVVPFVNVSNG